MCRLSLCLHTSPAGDARAAPSKAGASTHSRCPRFAEVLRLVARRLFFEHRAPLLARIPLRSRHRQRGLARVPVLRRETSGSATLPASFGQLTRAPRSLSSSAPRTSPHSTRQHPTTRGKTRARCKRTRPFGARQHTGELPCRGSRSARDTPRAALSSLRHSPALSRLAPAPGRLGDVLREPPPPTARSFRFAEDARLWSLADLDPGALVAPVADARHAPCTPASRQPLAPLARLNGELPWTGKMLGALGRACACAWTALSRAWPRGTG